MDVRNIAKVQIGIGALLLIISIIVGIVVTNLLYHQNIDGFNDSYERISKKYVEELDEIRGTGFSEPNLIITRFQTIMIFWIVSLVGSVISGILSIMLILQGLINLNKKK